MLSIAFFMVVALAVAGGVLWWTKQQAEQEREAERQELRRSPGEAEGGGSR